MIDPRLDGRVALVSGANHGIGSAIAKALAGQGAKVFVTYLRVYPREDPALPPDYYANRVGDAEMLLAQIAAEGGTAAAVEADLSDPATVPDLFERAEAQLGAVEILVNNAAFCEPGSFLGTGLVKHTGVQRSPVTPDGHDAHFSVNSRATALLIAEFARRHTQREARWGRIVSISSAGRDGFPNEASYGASKAALESYTFTAASELSRFGVTANVVEPSGTDSGWLSEELAEQIRKSSPFAHVLTPEDVAEAVLLLVSHQARFISGQRLMLR